MASRDAKVMWASVALSFALVAGFLLNPSISEPTPAPTPAPIKTVDPTLLTDLNQVFDPTVITKIHIDIPNKSKKVLTNKNRDDYVPATFQLTVGEKQTPKMEVAIKLKGTTSRYAITTTYEYSSFKVKFDFDKAHKDQTLLGLKSLTLNSMSQDSSKLHETFAYKAYREMGVPASRTGYAHLTLSKNIPKPDRGLYLTLESLDDVFLGENFQDVTQHLYENNHNFNEITPANIGANKKITPRFQVKEGWKATPNKNDLKAFAKGIQKSGKKLWDYLETNTDRDKLIMLFAVDNFTGGWDTYSGPLINNYQIRSNQQGKMTFLPWGLDNTWGENWFNDIRPKDWMKNNPGLVGRFNDSFFLPVDTPTASFPGGFLIAHSLGIKTTSKMVNYQFSRGLLFRKCLAFSICKTQYFRNLQNVSNWANEVKLGFQISQTARLLRPFMSKYEQHEQKRTILWLEEQQKRIATAIGKNCKVDLKKNLNCR